MSLMAARGPAPRPRGFTLIELLTVIAVMAVVTTLAAPGMRAFGLSQRAKAVSYDLVSDLLAARSEALKRNRTVTLRPLDGDWTSGWSVAVGDQRLLTRQIGAGNLDFDDAPATITFNVFGRIADPADPVRMTVQPADTGSDAARRCVEIDPSGYARTRLGACR